MVGVPAVVALLVTVLLGVVLVLAVTVLPGVVLEPVLQATRVGIRKSITRRLEPMHMRLESNEDFCILMYPLMDQDIHFRREEICETDYFKRIEKIARA
jgi:hypothetical protein